jgi:hypothetical protein
MPLLDHFHPPLSVRRHWQGFHTSWAGELARHLNHELPPRYFAGPHVQPGGQLQVDVAAFEERRPAPGAGGTTATAVWAPPLAPIIVPLDLGALDAYSVQILNDEEGPNLVAAIELLSPANKDRPASRRAFAVRCAGYLQQSVSMVVVDVVTTRGSNPHVELRALLGIAGPGDWAPLPDLSAVAYRTVNLENGPQLEAWPAALRLGERLPILPLWLSPDTSLPLDLERGYEATCEALRIGDVG